MKNKHCRLPIVFILFIIIYCANYSDAVGANDMPEMQMQHGKPPASSSNTVSAEVTLKDKFEKNKPVTTEIKLLEQENNKPLKLSDLNEVHNDRIHLLIFDETLMDYQHVHPLRSKKPGVYVFTWTPQTPNQYKVWADIIPKDSGRQEYVMANLGGISKSHAEANRKVNLENKIDNLNFTLSFDSPQLESGKAVMGKIVVQDSKGQHFKQLEPVMGAFAHIVAINEDFNTLAHIHPLGQDPEKSNDRGGPDLNFHFEPSKPGYWKIWVQVKVNGKDIFVPFGINVK